MCTYEMKPVCGSDFITYPNQCALDYANCVAEKVINKKIFKYYDGDCPTAEEPLLLAMLNGMENHVEAYEKAQLKFMFSSF